jgi:hypothetical protein
LVALGRPGAGSFVTLGRGISVPVDVGRAGVLSTLGVPVEGAGVDFFVGVLGDGFVFVTGVRDGVVLTRSFEGAGAGCVRLGAGATREGVTREGVVLLGSEELGRVCAGSVRLGRVRAGVV